MLAIQQPNSAKMLKNTEKAIKEHSYVPFKAAGSPTEESPLLPNVDNRIALTFKHQIAEDQGPRPEMEDARFYSETENAILAGVFDGHSGEGMADHACAQFQSRFFASLQAHNHDVYTTFNDLIREIHDEVKEGIGKYQGTTAVVTYIDKQTKTIYTATLGDSEANIYRRNGQSMVSIPLSCVRDWGSKKDAARLEGCHNLPEGSVKNFLTKNPGKQKYIRSGGIPSDDPYEPLTGVNVSRAMGDGIHGTKEGKTLISQKPKITMSTLQQGDIVVLSCDGLKDYVKEDKIAAVIDERVNHSKEAAQRLARLNQRAQDSSNIWESLCILVSRIINFISELFQKNIAKALVSEAVKIGFDNITVIAIEVGG